MKISGINNNDIWEHFGQCGEIESVHILRDDKTGQTKGFGYVNFKSKDAATLALKLNGTEICDRPVRVSPCLKQKEKEKKRRSSGSDSGNSPKKVKDNSRKNKVPPVSISFFHCLNIFFVFFFNWKNKMDIMYKTA